jgi:DNA-binding MarR family transcriptional regulator
MPANIKHQETIDYFLKIVWQTVANRYNQLVGDFGITQSIGYLLINIDEKEGNTVSEVAALLGLKSTSLSRMLTQLEQMDLIYRESNKGDKRSVKIFLTELGKEKRHLARVLVRQFNNYLDEHISGKEKDQLISTLKKINTLTVNYKPEAIPPPKGAVKS